MHQDYMECISNEKLYEKDHIDMDSYLTTKEVGSGLLKRGNWDVNYPLAFFCCCVTIPKILERKNRNQVIYCQSFPLNFMKILSTHMKSTPGSKKS